MLKFLISSSDDIEGLAVHTQNFFAGICNRLFNPFWKIAEGSKMVAAINGINSFVYGQIALRKQQNTKSDDILTNITYAVDETTGEGLSTKEAMHIFLFNCLRFVITLLLFLLQDTRVPPSL